MLKKFKFALVALVLPVLFAFPVVALAQGDDEPPVVVQPPIIVVPDEPSPVENVVVRLANLIENMLAAGVVIKIGVEFVKSGARAYGFDENTKGYGFLIRLLVFVVAVGYAVSRQVNLLTEFPELLGYGSDLTFYVASGFLVAGGSFAVHELTVLASILRKGTTKA